MTNPMKSCKGCGSWFLPKRSNQLRCRPTCLNGKPGGPKERRRLQATSLLTPIAVHAVAADLMERGWNVALVLNPAPFQLLIHKQSAVKRVAVNSRDAKAEVQAEATSAGIVYSGSLDV